MTIQFNGSAVTSVVFNGVAYTNVYMNGVKVLGVVRNLTVGKYGGDLYGFYTGSLVFGSLTNRAGSPVGTINVVVWRLNASGNSILEVQGSNNTPAEILLTLNGVTRLLPRIRSGAWQASIPYEEAHATLPTSGTYPVEIEVPL